MHARFLHFLSTTSIEFREITLYKKINPRSFDSQDCLVYYSPAQMKSTLDPLWQWATEN